ncbi:MAG TPA: CAP domain-containing protein [Bacteriovoracaceae bacterium]|nr:CAP domain-containing protein [Bacteriovoracaceae bacterium]
MRKFLILILLVSIANVNAATITFTESFKRLVNNHRLTKGLQPLDFEYDLNTIARTHSSNMASGKISFGHSGFSNRCSQGFQQLGGGTSCGENVAYGQATARAVFTSWMNSSGHRANIESRRYTHTGMGYKKNVNGVFYWTQIFFESR